MTKKFNNSNDVFLKVGKEVPEQDVNIAFYSTPKITPENNIKIIIEIAQKSCEIL